MRLAKLFFSGIFLCTTMLLYGHLVDIHVKTPSEIAEEERQQRERENERDREIYEDEDRSDEERREALGRLVDAEEIS